MSDYRNALSQSQIQPYLDGKKFTLNASDYVKRAWEYVQQDWGKTFMIGGLFYLLNIIAPWMVAGLFIGLYNERTKGEKIDANTLFKGFDHGMPIFMYLLITMGIMFAVMIIPMILMVIVLGIAGEGFIGFILATTMYIGLILLIMGVGVLLQFSLHFIVFAGMDAWPAMQTSAKIIRNNFVTTFTMAFIFFLVNMLGVLLCCVGVFITIPIIYIATYYAFEDVFRIEEGGRDDLDATIDHLV